MTDGVGAPGRGSEPVVVSWGGGKESALVLHRLRVSGRWRVAGLLSVVPTGPPTRYVHGLSRWLARSQAEALGCELSEVPMPEGPDDGAYRDRMETLLRGFRSDGIRRVASGDIHLESARERRERRLASVGMEALFPLWGEPPGELASECLDAGVASTITGVRASSGLDCDFLGRSFDRELLGDLPADVDACGEDGEFQTAVHDGPDFRAPLRWRPGPVERAGGYCRRALLPADPEQPSG